MEYNLMAMDPGTSHEDSLLIVENDLPRTFAKVPYFCPDTEKG
jgi:hypothetical protein